MVGRHEALRATFAELDGYPVQLVLPAWAPALMRLEMDASADDAAIAAAARTRCAGRSRSIESRRCARA
ncbi:hypothetical protein OV079_52445 [Nannocystis pusilla]|uniref:Condensation domain-containing protein n=1 Tax=Nannocystis pusilla TaxID=889268 RepID=A0A9X3F0V9_9BACT|nr:hypothetical protein [Nannocystis pusilla]